MLTFTYQKMEFDFLSYVDQMRVLMRKSLYFVKLADDYLASCMDIEALLRSENPIDQPTLHQMRKRRLQTKDEILLQLITAAKQGDVSQPSEDSIAIAS